MNSKDLMIRYPQRPVRICKVCGASWSLFYLYIHNDYSIEHSCEEDFNDEKTQDYNLEEISKEHL